MNIFILRKNWHLLPILLLFVLSTSYAQECYKPIAGPGVVVGGLSGTGICASQLCLGTNYNDIQKVVDNNIDTYADWGNLVTLLNFQGISVKNPTAFPAGYVAGFVFAKTGIADLSLFQNISVSTYLNGSVQETKSLSQLFSGNLIGGEQKFYLTFITTQAFDEVRLNTSLLSASILAGFKIYSAVAFPQDCNIENNLVCDDYISGPGTDVSYSGSFTCALCNLEDQGREIVNADKGDYTDLQIPVGLLTNVSVGVLDRRNVYPAGNRAGFVIAPGSANTILSADILNSITIQTYLFGELQDKASPNGTNAGLLNLNALNSSGNISKQKIGIITSKPFNEVRIVFNVPASVNVGSIRIYGAFEEPNTCNDCKISLTEAGVGKYNGSLQTGNMPGFLAGPWTGTYGVAIHNLSGQPQVVNSNTADYATYQTPLIVGVAAGAKITVKNDGTLFPTGTFAGFNISNQGSLIDLGLLNAITIKLFNNNTEVSSVTGSSLIGGSLIGGSEPKTTIGLYATAPFNRIQIDINTGALSVSLLGSYRIYDAFVIEDTDNDGVPNCQDVCPTGNDKIDTDGDGIPDCAEVAFADIVTKKELVNPAQTTFNRGDAIQYKITVTNNGPSAAAAVRVVDAAPAGTTLTSWTATGTGATPPVASGTGNLDQTIASMPNGSSVVYTITLQTDVNYAAPNLINITTVTSTTPDPDPTCPGCMTIGLPVLDTPDLTPLVDIDNLSFISNPLGERDFVVDLFEIAGVPTNGTITLRISRLSAFDITVPGLTLSATDQSGTNGTSNVGGGRANQNGNWTFKQNSGYITITSKQSIIVGANGTASIGFHIKRKPNVPLGTSQNLTTTIIANSGGEVNSDNNSSTTQVSATN